MTTALLWILALLGPVSLSWETHEQVQILCPQPPPPPNPYGFEHPFGSSGPEMVPAVIVQPCYRDEVVSHSRDFDDGAAAYRFILNAPNYKTEGLTVGPDRWVRFTGAEWITQIDTSKWGALVDSGPLTFLTAKPADYTPQLRVGDNVWPMAMVIRLAPAILCDHEWIDNTTLQTMNYLDPLPIEYCRRCGVIRLSQRDREVTP